MIMIMAINGEILQSMVLMIKVFYKMIMAYENILEIMAGIIESRTSI